MSEQDSSLVDKEDWFQKRNRVLKEMEVRDVERDLRIAESESRIAALLKNRPEPKVAEVEHGDYANYDVEVPPKHGPPAPVLSLE